MLRALAAVAVVIGASWQSRAEKCVTGVGGSPLGTTQVRAVPSGGENECVQSGGSALTPPAPARRQGLTESSPVRYQRLFPRPAVAP